MTTDTPPQVDLLSLTPDQLEAGIHAALKAHDVQAAYGFLLLLATKDPYRADEIRLVLKAGLALARQAESGGAA